MMLPDVDQESYAQYSADQFTSSTNDRIASLAAVPTPDPGLTAHLGGGPSPDQASAGSTADTSPPPAAGPSPEPPPAAPAPAPLPAPYAPVTAPLQAPQPAPTPAPSAQPDWIAGALNAVDQAGGDVQKFAQGLQTGAGDLIGSALNAADAAGADVQKFVSALPPVPAASDQSGAPTGFGSVTPTTAGLSGGADDPNSTDRSQHLLAVGGSVAAPFGGDASKAVQATLVTEGGMNRARGDNGQSAGPLQFYTGGQLANFASSHGMSVEQAKTYVDDHPEEAIQWAVGTPDKPGYLGKALLNGLSQGLGGADLATYIQKTGQVSVSPERAGANYNAMFANRAADASDRVAASQQVPGPVGAADQADRVQTQTVRPQSSSGAGDISQFGDPQLTTDEAYAACGPAAAVRFAEREGRNPTLREAVDLAKQVGWTPQQGMAGLGSEKALMNKMGVPTNLVDGPQWDVFAKEAQTGNPVTISTSGKNGGHYFFADGYNPDTGAFHVGRSGLDLKGGAEWMTPAQMQNLMGTVQGGLLADNPQIPTPSTADQQTNPLDWLGRQKDALTSSIGAGVSAIGAALQPQVSQPVATQTTPSDSLTDPLGTRYTLSPTGQPVGATSLPTTSVAPQDATSATPQPQGPLEAVKQKFSDAIDALGGLLAPAQPVASAAAGAAQDFAQNGPIGATRSAIQGATNYVTSGQARSDLADTLSSQADQSPLGPAIPAPVQSVALNLAAGLVRAPSAVDSAKTMMDLQQKYNSFDPSVMTPEDRQAYQNSMLAVGGLLGGEGATYDKFGVQEGFVPPAAKQVPPVEPAAPALEPEAAAQAPGLIPNANRARANAADIASGGTRAERLASPVPAQASDTSDTVLQGLINEAKQRGIDTSSIEAQIKPPITADMITSPAPAEAPPAVQYDANGNVARVNGRAVGGNGAGNGPPTTTGGTPPQPPEGPQGLPTTPPPVQRAGITPDTIQAAHERIDRAVQVGSARNYDMHQQLDTMLASGASPAEVARFLSGTVEGQTVTPMNILRSVRTGSMAGGLTTEGKVLAGPVIQTAMRAPVAAVRSLVTGNPGDIRAGLQGSMAGLAEGAQEALQTLRYGINYRSALAGGAQGGYGFAPGLDVMGKTPLTRAAGTLATGLVRTHGAIADFSAGIGRSAALGQGATPEAAAQAGQHWALRSGQYGSVGQAVSKALEGLRNVNPAMDVAGQILVPFYRVGYNAFTQGVERSPVGLVGTVADVARGKLPASAPAWMRGPYAPGANAGGAVTQVGDRLTNNMFGVGLAGLGLAQAASGNITGQSPPVGSPKWSIRVPETAKLGPVEAVAKRDPQGNLWVPIRSLGPAGEALAQSAALYEAARDGKGSVPDMAARSASEYVNHLEDETWLGSITSALNLIADVGNTTSSLKLAASQAKRDIAYQASSLGKSFIPQERLGEQVSKAFGNYVPPAAKPATPAAPVAPARTPAPTVTRRYVPPARATSTPRARP